VQPVKNDVDEGNVRYHLKRMDMIGEHPPEGFAPNEW